MLAARDQENLVYGHQQGGMAKQQGNRTLMPKTPAGRFMNENTVPTGKSVLGGKGTNGIMRTPLETRPRAVLGNKTTNAKTKTGQPLRVKDAISKIENGKSQRPSARKLKISHDPETTTLQSVGTKPQPEVEDIEVIPHRVPDLPYECDEFPRNGLTLEGLKPENRLKGYSRHWFDPVDENGVSLRQQKYDDEMKAVLDRGDKTIEREMEDLDWSVSDNPTTSKVVKPKKKTTTKVPAERKAPSTLAARNAATALAMPAHGTIRQSRLPKQPAIAPLGAKSRNAKKPLPITKPSRMESATSIANSRSTVGYNRGRVLSRTNTNSNLGSNNSSNRGEDMERPTQTQRSVTVGSMRRPAALASRTGGGLMRSVSTVSTDSDVTITPARFAGHESADIERLEFLRIFDPVGEGEGEDDGLFVEADHFAGVDEEFCIQIL